jgi:hypothetical protein
MNTEVFCENKRPIKVELASGKTSGRLWLSRSGGLATGRISEGWDGFGHFEIRPENVREA